MSVSAKPNLLRHTAVAALLVASCSVMVPRSARADADSDDKMSRLLDLLVQKKIVTQRQAHELLRQTEAPRAPRHSRPAEESAAPPAREGEVRVTYVPQFVRKQIADEVRAQVLTESQQEGWAAPGVIPDWTRRFKLYGDLRVRYERDTFDRGNYNQFINFAAINNGSPFDQSNFGAGLSTANPPLLNTTEDRDRPRVRARVGVEAFIDDGLTADVRITTGADNGPVSPNQTQGVPGEFSKYNVFIDRAFFAYQPRPDVTLLAGRENNPFFTTDLFFYSELGFDGLAAQYTPKLSDTVGGFLNAGVFPILNTAFDFSTNSFTKFGSANAYLLAIQGGAKWQVKPDLAAKFGVGFFDFNGVQGAVSKPCVEQVGAQFYCSTDNTRFPFQQFGNTVYQIRDIVTAGQSTNPPISPEYYGLASRFAVLEVHPRVEITTYHPIDVLIEGEYLKNLAYNRENILNHGPPAAVGPVNNFGSTPKGLAFGPYQGGDTAYVIKATVGNLEIHHRWDWNVTAAYKYLETDSTLDSITDSDFHLGGTNAKGYILTGSVGVARDTFLSLRYFSSQVVSGPPDGNQVLQLDLQSTF